MTKLFAGEMAERVSSAAKRASSVSNSPEILRDRPQRHEVRQLCPRLIRDVLRDRPQRREVRK